MGMARGGLVRRKRLAFLGSIELDDSGWQLKSTCTTILTMEPIDFQKQFAKQCRKAERHLSAACPKLASWIHQCGKCTLEPQWTREPFESLVRAIAHQQLHGKAAESILGRLISSFPGQAFPTAPQVASLRSPKLRSMGFSEAKTLAIKGVAKETLSGVIPDREVSRQLSDEELIARLIPSAASANGP